MKVVSSLLVFGLLASLHQKVLSKPAEIQIRRGEDAKDGEFPYMVEVRSDGCFICGGSIIAPKWILTAGHCISEESLRAEGAFTIVYGTKFLYDCRDNDDDPDTVIHVKAAYRHPNWTSFENGAPTNDIGLFQLAEEIPFDALAQPITLTEETKDAAPGGIGNLTGWGSSVSGDYPIINLQKIQLPILSNEGCTSRIDGVQVGVVFNGTEAFCTDDQDNGQCNGDSGSPFVINGTQYGVVSWSIKPCGTYPGVFTRVALPENRQWIKEVTGV